MPSRSPIDQLQRDIEVKEATIKKLENSRYAMDSGFPKQIAIHKQELSDMRKQMRLALESDPKANEGLSIDLVGAKVDRAGNMIKSK